MSNTTSTLDDIVYCDTGCGSNADPADGFGYCTCGAEDTRKAIEAYVAQKVIEELKLTEANNMFRNQDGLPRFIRHEEYIKERIKFWTNNMGGEDE